jgi:hypothetical protein
MVPSSPADASCLSWSKKRKIDGGLLCPGSAALSGLPVVKSQTHIVISHELEAATRFPSAENARQLAPPVMPFKRRSSLPDSKFQNATPEPW